MSYRVGVVSYLNAKPLTWALERGEIAGVEAVAAVPSDLGVMLAAGELDAALLSTVVALRDPALVILREAGCLAADGAVQSVLLLTKVHLRQVRSVALDASSLTSIALARLLLERRWGLRPSYHVAPPDLRAMLAEHDAALLIGDPGLAHYFAQAAPTRLFDAIDLAHAWHDWTGLPFVFAAWLARRADAALVGLLRAARLRSHAAIPEIAACEAARLDLPEDVCRYYLEEVIRYELGPREEAGLAQFAAYLAELDAADVQTGGTP